jgi:hypothetical protein
LNADDFVHSRTDQRELQALRHANISIDDFAEVERDTEVENQAVDRRRRRQSPARFESRGERPAASFLRRALDPEQAEHRITNQADDLATVVKYGRRRHLEITTEKVEERFGGKLIGKFGRTAQITKPQRRGDFFAITAADRAVEDSLAGTFAEIGMGNVLRDATLELRL